MLTIRRVLYFSVCLTRVALLVRALQRIRIRCIFSFSVCLTCVAFQRVLLVLRLSVSGVRKNIYSTYILLQRVIRAPFSEGCVFSQNLSDVNVCV